MRRVLAHVACALGAPDAAAVGLDQAAGDQAQRRLPGPVLAQQRRHRPRLEAGRRVADRGDRPELLADPGHSQRRSRPHRPRVGRHLPHCERSGRPHAQGQLGATGADERLCDGGQQPGSGCCQVPRGLLRGSGKRDPAGLHDHHAVGLCEQPGRAVLGQHDGDAAVVVQAYDQAQQLLGGHRVELARRFIEQQGGRPHCQHGRDGDPLLLASGELDVPASGEVRGSGCHQGLVCLPGDQVRWESEVLESEDGLGQGALGDELRLRVLKHQAGVPRQLGGPHVTRVLAVERDPPGQLSAVEVRHQAGGGPKQGRLAAAGLSDHQHQLTGLDVEVDAVQRGTAAARVAVTNRLERQSSHRTTPAAAPPSTSIAADAATAAVVTGFAASG